MPADSLPPSPPSAPPPRKSGGRFRHALILLTLFAGPAAAYWLWSWTSVPRPPSFSLEGVDAPVAEAIRNARSRINFAPRSPANWGLLGMVLAANGFEDYGRECFRVAESLDSDDPRWPYFQAYTSGSALPPGTEEALQRAVQLCGDVPAPRLRLGEILIDVGKVDEAEGQFDHVLQGSPDYARALLGLARVAFARGQWDTAIEHLERSLTRAPNNRAAHSLLAQARFRIGDANAAERSQQRASELPAVTLWPDPFLEEFAAYEIGPLALTRRAELLRSNGEIEAAISIARRAAELYPESAQASFILGRILALNRRDPAEAESALRAAFRLQPDAPEALLFLGKVLVQQERLAEAAEAYRDAIRLRDNYAAAYFHLGQCLNALQDRPGAIDAFRNAARCRPDGAGTHKNLALLLADERQFREALDHARRALELQPDDDTRKLVEQLETLNGPVLPP